MAKKKVTKKVAKKKFDVGAELRSLRGAVREHRQAYSAARDVMEYELVGLEARLAGEFKRVVAEIDKARLLAEGRLESVLPNVIASVLVERDESLKACLANLDSTRGEVIRLSARVQELDDCRKVLVNEVAQLRDESAKLRVALARRAQGYRACRHALQSAWDAREKHGILENTDPVWDSIHAILDQGMPPEPEDEPKGGVWPALPEGQSGQVQVMTDRGPEWVDPVTLTPEQVVRS